MTANEIRQQFLGFFQKKGHKIVPSAPIVLKNDPTLMFTNAGMNQFKEVFLGIRQAEAPRIADTQKCLRVSGKHNDLDEVGKDTYHHTMFEMLGNWSFGDYFKKEAIHWAWELLTGVYGIDKSRLYVTIFEGSKEDGLEVDREAYGLWKELVPEDHIIQGSKKDNFWEMGETGPCGPASEIHYDNRTDEERKTLHGADLVNKGLHTVIEIWNLVFIQYNRKSNGQLEPLPQKHVDTGMGFERLCMVLQGKNSNYETDVFTPFIEKIANITGKKYHTDEQTDIAIRVVADHIRAIGFAIADGQLPSNTGAGYVIRRILRRAVRYGYSYLGMEGPFLYKLVPVLIENFGNIFPNLKDQQPFVEKVVREEELSFLRTLETGLRRLEQFWKNDTVKAIPGEAVFELYDTYGFPDDLTRLIALEHGFQIDEDAFQAEMAKQKTRSKKATKVETEDWTVVNENGGTDFIGYDSVEAKAKILKYRKVRQRNKESYQVVLDRTPFYAESGGQVGDTGILVFKDGTVQVLDTRKENEQIVHYVDHLPEVVTGEATARIDYLRRKYTANNHSSTHLLHAALKQVLGSHVQQKGSYVGPDRLRFDFSHFEKVSKEALQKIEQTVNDKIFENIPLDEQREVPIAKAEEMGATALFGEKYGDFVRVITFDPEFSRELCGGIHVPSTGQIGLFKIVNESAVAAGVRRIEAVTSKKALEYVNAHIEQLEEIAQITKTPNDVVKGVQNLAGENNRLKKELEELSVFKVNAFKDQLKGEAVPINGINFIGKVTDLGDADSMKQLAYDLKKEVKNLVLAIGTQSGKKALLTIMISEDLVKEKGLHAGELIREASQKIKGGGGGQPFFATAGGGDPSGLQAAVNHVKNRVIEHSGGK